MLDDVDNNNDDEGCMDGNWRADGLGGMFLKFNRDRFCDDELEEIEAEETAAAQQEGSNDAIGLAVSHTRIMEHEFLTLPTGGDEQGWARLHIEIIKPRQLHIADFIARRFAEGNYHPRIRIRRLSAEDMENLLTHKKYGNDAFIKKEYAEAVQHYNHALRTIDHTPLFVAPLDQIKEVVNVLSNQAECYLRLKKFRDAGNVATMALMFDNSHEKSRMRRAKAELAIAGDSYLIQAQADLQEIMDNQTTKPGVKEAKDFLEQLDELLRMAKRTFEEKNSDGDWELYVRMVTERCW